MRDIGMMIKAARKRSGMTQGELDEMIGVTTATVCEMENNVHKSQASPDRLVAVSDAVKDAQMLHEYCDSCPVRRRIIIRKFKPLNNILAGAHVSIMKVCQKLTEAAESLTVMLPKMLRSGFRTDPDYLEYRNTAVLKILDVKRGTEILIDQLLADQVLTVDELRMLVDMQQRLCEAHGHHIPDKEEGQ